MINLDKTPFISIVIPAYNVEKYIEQCIQSINSQTFQEYEVIIVDDGSTDKTLEVIYKNINNKYLVLTQKNQGAGIARNIGIENATGEYLTFIDADDFLYNNLCLEKLAKCIKSSKCDMVVYKMVRYYQKNQKELVESNITSNNHKCDVEDYLKSTVASSRLSVSPCDKVIKTDIIKNNEIYFEKFAMLEDIDWSLKLYKYIKNVMVFNEPIYVYRKGRTNSTTSYYSEKKTHACYNFIKKWCNYCNQNNSIYSELYLNYIAYQYIILMTAINKKNCNDEVFTELKKYSWLLNYDMNFKVKKANNIYKIFGYRVMIVVLKVYMYLKNRNLILISR